MGHALVAQVLVPATVFRDDGVRSSSVQYGQRSAARDIHVRTCPLREKGGELFDGCGRDRDG